MYLIAATFSKQMMKKSEEKYFWFERLKLKQIKLQLLETINEKLDCKGLPANKMLVLMKLPVTAPAT